MKAIYETVDKCLAQFPPGQVEMGVDAYDATSLTAWLQKHSDIDCAGSNQGAFIFGVSNVHAVGVAGRQGLEFGTTSSGCGGPGGSGHETVFLLSSTLVFTIDWWAAREGYSGTISAIESQMLGTFTG